MTNFMTNEKWWGVYGEKHLMIIAKKWENDNLVLKNLIKPDYSVENAN